MEVVECPIARKDIARIKQEHSFNDSYEHWKRRVARAGMTTDLVLWVKAENLSGQLWRFERGRGMRIFAEIRDHQIIYVVGIYEDHDRYQRDRNRKMFDAGAQLAERFRKDADKAHAARPVPATEKARRVHARWESPFTIASAERLWRAPHVLETVDFVHAALRAGAQLSDAQLCAGVQALQARSRPGATDLRGYVASGNVVLTGIGTDGDAPIAGEAEASRSYPIMAPSSSAWGVINSTRSEADNDPCVPFSAEQRHLLCDLAQGNRLPMLIDGPAGSGKSTLLGATLAIASVDGDAPPLFVTHSDDLRRATHDRMANILQVHFDLDRASAEHHASDSCRSTESYLLEVLDNAGLPYPSHDFAGSKRCQFIDFRKNLASACSAHQISVELAWFVIRAFVKGYGSPDDATDDDVRITHLTLDEFEEVPESARQGVTPQQFARAARVAGAYTEWLEKHQRWDDQDLAHAALRAIAHRPEQDRRCAIVCDEAQDLTRADLRVLFRCFTRAREIATSNATHISLPFVFAADPQQTVNPSGFSWKGFRELLWQETSLLFGDRSAVRREPDRLRCNFRSTPEIVALSDLVNHERWRTSARNDRGQPPTATEPQRRDRGRVHRYLWDEETTVEGLSSSLRLIRPSGWTPSPGQAALEPKTAAQVKGLEFAEAIVLGFGDALHALDHASRAAPDDEARDFLLNELYVAVTRARDGVHFVDSQDGAATLWNEFLGGAAGITTVDLSLGHLTDAIEQDHAAIREATDLLRRAFTLGDAGQARSAARTFERVGEEQFARAATAVEHLLDAATVAEDWAALAGSPWQDAAERFLWDRRDRDGFRSLLRHAPRSFTAEGFLGMVDVALDHGQGEESLEAVVELIERAAPASLPSDRQTGQVLARLASTVKDTAERSGAIPRLQGFWLVAATALLELQGRTENPDVTIAQMWAAAATGAEGLAAAQEAAGDLASRGALPESLEQTTTRLLRVATGLTWLDPATIRGLITSFSTGDLAAQREHHLHLLEALAAPGNLDTALASIGGVFEKNPALADMVAAAVIEHSATTALHQQRELTAATTNLLKELNTWMS